MNNVYTLLLARRGAAAGRHLLRCHSSTMSPHRLRRGALHLPARRSRQSAQVISTRTLTECLMKSQDTLNLRIIVSIRMPAKTSKGYRPCDFANWRSYFSAA